MLVRIQLAPSYGRSSKWQGTRLSIERTRLSHSDDERHSLTGVLPEQGRDAPCPCSSMVEHSFRKRADPVRFRTRALVNPLDSQPPVSNTGSRVERSIQDPPLDVRSTSVGDSGGGSPQSDEGGPQAPTKRSSRHLKARMPAFQAENVGSSPIGSTECDVMELVNQAGREPVL